MIVRMSARLRDTMIEKVTEPHNQRLKAAWGKFETTEFGDQLYNDLVPAHLQALLAQIPAAYLNTTSQTDMEIENRRVGINFSSPRPTPGWSRYLNNLKLLPGTKSWSIAQQYLQEIRQLSKEKEAALVRISPLIRQSPSLQYLTKIWPSALDFVDDETRIRFSTPPAERPPTEKKERPVMTDEALIEITKIRLSK